MEGKKPKDLKSKSFNSIQKMFDRAFKRVNTFVDVRTDLVKGSSKKAGTELEQELTKKQKVDDVQEITKMDNDQEAAKIKELMKIVSDVEEVAIDAIPLATKPPTTVDWKIHKEGKKNYYQIIRADGSLKIGGLRFDSLGDLKTMFEPHVKDKVWNNQQDYRVLDWKIYDSCGVHSLRMQHMHIHMLVEKIYPLTPAIITDMLNKKLQCYHFSKMAYQLLKVSQNNGRIVKIKSFLMLFGITATLIDVNAAQSKLMLLVNFNENYSKCLRLLEEVTTARGSYYY
ncbi:hypothetical protein Tco_0869822 [Tanacetum coccineum]